MKIKSHVINYKGIERATEHVTAFLQSLVDKKIKWESIKVVRGDETVWTYYTVFWCEHREVEKPETINETRKRLGLKNIYEDVYIPIDSEDM